MIDLWASLKVVWRYLSIVLFFSPGYDEIINCSLYYFIYIFGIGKIFFKLFLKDKFFLMKNTVQLVLLWNIVAI